MSPEPNVGNLTLRIPLVMLAMIFLVESAIMAVFALVKGENRSPWLGLIVDASVLTLTMAPLMFRFVVRPLKSLADERSRLLAHMMDIQEEERRQVARDLHDEIGQSFTSLLVRLRLVEDATSLDAAKAQAGELRELSGSIYDQIRNLARTLHPTVLDDLGLVEAIRRLGEDFEALHATTVTVKVAGIWKERLPRKIETAVFRIVQESLTNCAKYAHATHINVTLARRPSAVEVTIGDNGLGFNVGVARHPAGAAGFGLSGMRERALLVQGSLEVQSSPGSGTTVELRIPVRN